MTRSIGSLLLGLGLWFLLVLGCSQPQHETATSKQKASGETLPVTASAYENVEPLTTERITTVPVTDRFARRVFKDPQHPDNWHELIIGTGNDSEKVYAYFHFVPLDVVQTAERDERELRWGLLFGKYGYLANIPVSDLRGDYDLVKECKEATMGFYEGLRDSPVANEGVDIRGIHLAVRRQKAKGAVIIGLTSYEWNDIRHAIMRGEKHELYSLFP
jgi:hypothetical protein